jgi:tape measure domain-containing protein
MASLRDGITANARRMRSSIAGLRGSIRDLQKTASSSRMSRGFSGMGKAISDMHGRWQKFQKSDSFQAVQGGVGKIKDGLLIASAVALGTAAAIGTAAVRFANFAQTSVLGYEAVSKSANAAGMSAEQLFSRARKEAERFGLDVLETSNAFKGFMVQGASPEMATNLVRMGADLGAIGASSEQVQSSFRAINKIMSQGKLQGDELMILAEAGINVGMAYEAMGKSAGKSVDEIKKMQQAGTLTSDIALPGIIEAVTQMTGGKQAGDAGKKLADSTLSGMAGQLKAGFQNMFIDVSRQATPAIMSAFGAIREAFGGAIGGQGFQQGLVTAIETIANVIREAVPFVESFVGAFVGGFEEFFPAVQGALDLLFTGFGGKQDWMENVKQFGRTLGKVAAIAVGVGTVFGGMVVAGLELTSKALETVMFLFEGLVTGIGKGIFAITDFFANLSAKWEAFDFGAFAGQIIDGLVNGIFNGLDSVWSAVMNLGQTVIDALRSALNLGSPSKETAFIGEMAGAGLEGGFIKRMRAANDNMGRATEDLLPAIEGPVAASVAASAGMPAGSMSGGGGFGGDVKITINVQQQPGENSQDLAERIARECRRVFDARIEELAIEAA